MSLGYDGSYGRVAAFVRDWKEERQMQINGRGKPQAHVRCLNHLDPNGVSSVLPFKPQFEETRPKPYMKTGHFLVKIPVKSQRTSTQTPPEVIDDRYVRIVTIAYFNIRRPFMEMNKSHALYDRAIKVLVEGVSSSSRGPVAFGCIPPYMSHGKEKFLHDVDGNVYLDWMMAFGALPLGHGHPKVVEAVAEAIVGGSHLATALEIEVELAEMLIGLLPHAEKIRFANTGTEAAMCAFRLARGLTGRRKIIKFEGHYHGWWDGVLLNSNANNPYQLGHRFDPVKIPDSSGLTPGALEDTVIVPWNDFDALERAMALHGRDTACVVTEGVMSNFGVIPPKEGYLQRMQELCRHHGALFYLDETVTGFRLAPGGCAELYGLKPDIVTYGKALGGGMPVAAIAGPTDIMSGLEWGKVLHFGTHNAGRLSLTVSKIILETMLADEKAGFRHNMDIGAKMAAAVNDMLRTQNKHHAFCQNVTSMFQIFFTDDNVEEITDYRDFCTFVNRPKFRDFSLKLMEKGIWISPSATLHSLPSILHTEEDIKHTVAMMAEVLDEWDH